MQKDVILILSLFEGRNWHPLDNRHSVVLVGRLSSHILSTDLTPLKSCPKFNTEFSWYTDKQTIRSFKLNRIPIKLECYSVNDKKQRSSLGYVIIPLTPAVEGSKVDAKWHKILGGSSIPHKDPPSLLLSLSLEAMTLDQQKQNSDKFTSSMKSQLYLEHATILPNAIIKNSFTYVGSDNILKNSVPINNINGNSDIVRKSMVGAQNHNLAKSSNGVCTKDNTMVDLENDESLDEESDDDYFDGDTNYSSDDTIEGYSLTNEIRNEIYQQDGTNSGTGNLHDIESKEEKDKKTNDEKGTSVDQIADHNNKLSKVTSPNFNFEISERAAIKESLRSSLKQTSLLSPELSFQQSSFSKRTLDTSGNLNEPEQKFKKCKTNNVENSPKSSYKDLFRNFKSHALLDIENNPEATSTALLLSQSLKKMSSPTQFSEQRFSFEAANKGVHNNSLKKRLNAHLNEAEGFFQIGHANANDFDYVYSVTIIYAENLNQVVSIDVASIEHRNFQFRYFLLDCPITTDTFTNLDDPEFMSEKATASIRCISENLSEYFNQHSILSIQLVNNETCLALCTIDMKSLVSIIDKEHVLLEGPFDIYGVGVSSCLKDMSNRCTAKLGVSIELYKSGNGKFYSKSFLNREICSLKDENLLKVSSKDCAVGSSKSSDSESDCKSAMYSKKKLRDKSEKRFCSCCSKHHSRNQEENRYLRKGDVANYQIALMNKAKKEVKDWKIERRKCFENELDIYAKSIQEKLINECQSQLKEMENDLNYRLKECDLLKEQLSSTMHDLTLREEALHSRETKVAKMEKELLDKKAKLLLPVDERISSKNEGGDDQIEDRQGISDTKLCQIEFQNCRLQEEYVRSESTIRELTLENIDLKRQLIQSENFISTVKEKDILAANVEALQERKRYYKEKWMTAISEMHMIHTSNKKYVNRITSDSLLKEKSEIELEKYNTISMSSHTGYKLKKLKEERKILMEGGHYNSDHAIIKNIDSNIRKLVLGSS